MNTIVGLSCDGCGQTRMLPSGLHSVMLALSMKKKKIVFQDLFLTSDIFLFTIMSFKLYGPSV